MSEADARAIETSHGPYPIKINPGFDKRIDGMIHELAEVSLQIRQPIKRARTILSELQDYVSFEIEKTEVRGARAEMAGDEREVEGSQLWVQNLRVLHDGLDPEEVMRSFELVNTAIKAMKVALQGKEVDQPEG